MIGRPRTALRGQKYRPGAHRLSAVISNGSGFLSDISSNPRKSEHYVCENRSNRTGVRNYQSLKTGVGCAR